MSSMYVHIYFVCYRTSKRKEVVIVYIHFWCIVYGLHRAYHKVELDAYILSCSSSLSPHPHFQKHYTFGIFGGQFSCDSCLFKCAIIIQRAYRVPLTPQVYAIQATLMKGKMTVTQQGVTSVTQALDSRYTYEVNIIPARFVSSAPQVSMETKRRQSSSFRI